MNEALTTIVDTAQAAGAEGVWLLRGAKAAMVGLTFDGEAVQSLELAEPHELILIIRFPVGDGGEAGIESR